MRQHLTVDFGPWALCLLVCSGIATAEPGAPKPVVTSTENRPLAYYATSGPSSTSMFALLPFPEEFLKVDLLRLGKTAVYENGEMLQLATRSLTDIYYAPDLDTRKNCLLQFTTAHPGEAINICVLRYYFMLLASEETTAPSLAEFAERVPPQSALPEPGEQTEILFFLFDQAWQADAEGRGNLALEYFERCRELSWQIASARPTDPRVVPAVGYFARAAQSLGVVAGAECIKPLRSLVSANPVTLPSWFARYNIGYISATNGRLRIVSALRYQYPNGLVPDEHRHQYDKGFDDFYLNDVVPKALADPDLIQPIKCLIHMMIGYVYFNIDDWYDAETQYVTALRESEHEMQWEPRTRDVAIVNASTYGMREKLAFAFATARYCQYVALDPARAVAAWQEFVDAFPRAELADYALIDMGRMLAKMGRVADADIAFNRIINEYPTSELIEDAKADLAKLEAQGN